MENFIFCVVSEIERIILHKQTDNFIMGPFDSSSFKDADLIKLVDKSNDIFQSLATEEELKYFTYKYNKATDYVKMSLLPEILKRLVSILGRSVISNCSTPTEKVSEFLDHHLEPIMRSGMSYINNTNYFLPEIENLNKLSDNATSTTDDVAGLYPSIPHNKGLKTVKKKLNIVLMKIQFLLKLCLKSLNLFLKTILISIQMWTI